MAENQTSTSSQPEGVCEKIYNAICCGPPPPSPDKEMTTTEEVPVVVSTPAHSVMGHGLNQAARVAPNNELVQTRRRGAAPPAKAGQGEEGSGNENFSEYIDRAKAKFRTTSTVGGGGGGHGGGEGKGHGGGGGKGISRLDTFHDRVNNYLHRARNKMRTTSTVGGRRSVSID